MRWSSGVGHIKCGESTKKVNGYKVIVSPRKSGARASHRVVRFMRRGFNVQRSSFKLQVAKGRGVLPTLHPVGYMTSCYLPVPVPYAPPTHVNGTTPDSNI